MPEESHSAPELVQQEALGLDRPDPLRRVVGFQRIRNGHTPYSGAGRQVWIRFQEIRYVVRYLIQAWRRPSRRVSSLSLYECVWGDESLTAIVILVGILFFDTSESSSSSVMAPHYHHHHQSRHRCWIDTSPLSEC